MTKSKCQNKSQIQNFKQICFEHLKFEFFLSFVLGNLDLTIKYD